MLEWSMHTRGESFVAGEKVELVSNDYPDDHRCNGEFIVADALNARYTDRGDLFQLHRKDNISCRINIFRL
jgi:hypothetical protein